LVLKFLDQLVTFLNLGLVDGEKLRLLLDGARLSLVHHLKMSDPLLKVFNFDFVGIFTHAYLK